MSDYYDLLIGPTKPRPLIAHDPRPFALPDHVRGIVRSALIAVRAVRRSDRVGAARREAAFWADRHGYHAANGADPVSPFQRARMASHYFCAAEAIALADADLSMARQAQLEVRPANAKPRVVRILGSSRPRPMAHPSGGLASPASPAGGRAVRARRCERRRARCHRSGRGQLHGRDGRPGLVLGWRSWERLDQSSVLKGRRR